MRQLLVCVLLFSLAFAGTGCSKEDNMQKGSKKQTQQASKKAVDSTDASNNKKYATFTEECKKEISAKCPDDMDMRRRCVNENATTFSPACTKQFIFAELKQRRR